MKGKWMISISNTKRREVSKMKKRAFAILTIAALIAALVVVVLPGAAAASGVFVRSKMVQSQEHKCPEGEDEVENQGPPEDEGSLNCPNEQDNYPPEEEAKPPETPDKPQDTPNDTPSEEEEELPCTAGNSSLYIWLGLAGLLIGAVGMAGCKVIQPEEI